MRVPGIFGLHDVPLRINLEEISLPVERAVGGLLCKKECMDEEIEDLLLSSNSKILINPVEPVNNPKELTPHFLIEFEKSIFIEPSARKTVFVKFPVEIDVFVHGKKDFQILDVLTLNKQKFTLYGDVISGVICKCWESEVYSTIPDTNPVYEGVIELNITNTTARWVEVTKAVFAAHGMKIYYSDDANLAIEIIEDLIDEQPFALKKPSSQVSVDNLGDNSVNILVRVWAPATEWYELKMELLWEIKKTLEENRTEIAFPQRVVWFAGELRKREDAESGSSGNSL
jgi:hypothetical protein